jgi:hypothetical protein
MIYYIFSFAILAANINSNKQNFKPTIEENLNNGRLIRLSDNSTWQIHPNDTALTQSWITPVEIEVEETEDREYPYLLKNTLTGSKVRAKKPD